EWPIVLCYTFTSSDYRRTSYDDLLLSFNLQLLYWGDLGFDSPYVRELSSRMGEESATTSPDLHRLFFGLLTSLSNFTVVAVIDGLDECNESSRSQLIGDLRRLARDSSRHKVFITYRPTDSIVALLEPSNESNRIDLDKGLNELKGRLLRRELGGDQFASLRDKLAGETTTPLMIKLLSVLGQPNDTNEVSDYLDYNAIYKQI
ncbi:hypothetical protein F4818DRAFT_450899, partial [Hypoxylon cercidicola]